MELIQWANGKGYTLLADGRKEFELLKENLDKALRWHYERGYMTEVEVDESELAKAEEDK